MLEIFRIFRKCLFVGILLRKYFELDAQRKVVYISQSGTFCGQCFGRIFTYAY